jgi:hypothetical protein
MHAVAPDGLFIMGTQGRRHRSAFGEEKQRRDRFFFACSLQRAARIKPNGPLPLPSTHGLSLAPDGLSWGLKGAGTAAVLMKRTAKPKSKFSSPSPAARGRAARSEPAHC